MPDLILATLFLDPIQVHGFWPWLLIPLAAAIAIVYKTVKVRYVRHVPLAALWLTLTILVGMALAGEALYLIFTYWPAS